MIEDTKESGAKCFRPENRKEFMGLIDRAYSVVVVTESGIYFNIGKNAAVNAYVVEGSKYVGAYYDDCGVFYIH